MESTTVTNNNQFKKDLDIMKTVLLSFIGWSVLVPLVTLSALYRKLVDLVLKLRWKKKYGGLFDGRDVMYFMPSDKDSWICSITSVFYIKCQRQTDVYSAVMKTLQEKVFDHPELYPKLTGAKRSFGGYPYWLKNELVVDDVLKRLNIPDGAEFNEETLKELVAKISDSKHGKMGQVLWDLHVSSTPLVTSHNDGFHRYALVARFHHSIADGTSLIALLIRLFGDESSQNYGVELYRKLFNTNQPTRSLSLLQRIKITLTNFVNLLCLSFEVVFLSLGRLFENDTLRTPDNNALKNVSYSGRKVVAWATEEKPECLNLVKNVKNSEKCKFVSVLTTGIVASITKFFTKNNFPVPKDMTTVTPVLIDFPTLDSTKPVPLENKLTVAIFNIPSIHKSSSMLSALKTVNKAINKQVKYSDLLLVKYYLKYGMGCMPIPLVNAVSGFNSQTFLFTNVPGGSAIKILDGCELEKVVPLAPVIKGVGAAFAIVSYDDRLQVGVAADRKLMTQEEVQKMADDVLDYIRRMGAETAKRLLQVQQ